MRALLATTLILTLMPSFISAQEAQKKAAPPAPRGAALTGEDDNAVQGVRLARADVRAVIHGNLAQAVMTLTFANNQPRVLGGNLVFPLPEGATVTGYGLDIGGQMVDGVAVEKERARRIYEEEIHKRVDPGLVEHVEGNAFRTRLYPIPPNGTRSIKIEYVTQIEQGKESPSLTLPLAFGDGLDELAIRIEAPDAATAPSVQAGAIDGFAFAKAEHGFVAAASAKNAPSADQLVIALPQLPATSVAIEKRAKFPRTIEELQGPQAIDHLPAQGSFETFEHYFAITDSPEAPMIKRAPFKDLRIGVVWDASLSRLNADHARELKLLEIALIRLGYPAADLIVLRNTIEVKPFFAPGGDGAAKLVDTIKSLPYDGATNFGALALPKNVSAFVGRTRELSPDYDMFLLFTDGMGNLGPDRPARAEAPIFAMCDDLRANHTLLRALCQQSGGAYFNLSRVSDAVALSGIGVAPYSVVSIECKPDEIVEIYPPVGTAVDGRFILSGKLLVPHAKLTIHYGHGQRVEASQTFILDAAGAPEGSLLPRFWAQQKVTALSIEAEKNAEELTRLGKQFNLVTPNTSLLVLETVEQYVQYRVVPPPTRPEIYRQFLVKIEEHRRQETDARTGKTRAVVALWQARVQWWDKEYKYPADLRVKPGDKKDGIDQISGVVNAPVPAVAPRTFDARREVEQRPGPYLGPREQREAEPRFNPEDLTTPDMALNTTPGNRSGRAREVRRLDDGRAVPHELEGALLRRESSGLAADHVLQLRAATQPAGAAVQARLDHLIPEVPFENAGLADCIDFLREAGGARIVVNWKSLESAGVGRTTPVTLKLRNVKVAKALTALLDKISKPDAKIVYAIQDEAYLISTEKDQTKTLQLWDEEHNNGIKSWDPQTPYIVAMKAVAPDKAYDVFLAQRTQYARSPAFYFDCADYLVKIGQADLGIRVLTDIVELELADARLIRIAAHRLNQIGQRELAIDLFEKVLRLRPEEPQSYRDLALALADRADATMQLAWAIVGNGFPSQEATDAVLADYVRSLELLNKVVMGDWPRFPEIELPVLMEANDIAGKAERLPHVHDFHNPLDWHLQKNLDLDLRVVMTWDADQTDIDLWVTEPSGEKCLYSHNRTVIGGLLSHDYTDGYGPEEYCLRKAMPGRYLIQANFYGSHQQELTGPATVQATVITHFGRPDEKRQALTLRLKDMKEVVDVGTLTLDAAGEIRTEPAAVPAPAAQVNK